MADAPMQRKPAEITAELDAARRTIEVLNGELEETNKGVLALYSELDTQAEQLRQATELKSQFLAYMSHEFKTPLGAIQSISRILLDHMDGPLTSEQERQVGFIQSAAKELSEMVSDLLDLAKVEAGRISISPAWFELVDLFSALRGMFKPILTNSDVQLVFDEPTGIARAYADDKKLSQILRNFISNALKFTLKGEVHVSCRKADAEGFVTFAVSDTGIGIPEDQLGRLFKEFTQIESPLQVRVRGTGLGLALSRKLAIVMGGSILVESQVGHGSTFSLTIPAIPTTIPDNNRESVNAANASLNG